jgi:hypothetical protein
MSKFKSYFIFALCVLPYFTNAQVEAVYLKGGISLSTRFLNTKSMKPSDAEFLKNNEVLRMSYSSGLGAIFRLNAHKSIDCQLSYDQLQFGSKLFQIPSGQINNTPQYNYIKETAVLRYVTLRSSLNQKIMSLDKTNIDAQVGMGIHYLTQYYLKGFATDEFAKSGLSTKELQGWNTSFTDLNTSLSFGIAFSRKLNNRYRLCVEPNFDIYLFPLITRGDRTLYGSNYLFIKDKTKGNLYNLALNIKFVKTLPVETKQVVKKS